MADPGGYSGFSDVSFSEQSLPHSDEAEQAVVRLQKGPDGAPVEVPFDMEAE